MTITLMESHCGAGAGADAPLDALDHAFRVTAHGVTCVVSQL